MTLCIRGFLWQNVSITEVLQGIILSLAMFYTAHLSVFFCKNCYFWQEVHRSFYLLEGFGGFVIIKRPLKTINDSKRGHNPNQLKIKMSDSGYPWKTEYEVKYTCTMNLNKVSRRQRLNRQNVLFWYSMSYRLYD